MLRACTRVTGAGAAGGCRRGALMASLLAFSSSRVLPPKPQPPPTPPDSSPVATSARPSRLRFLLARAVAGAAGARGPGRGAEVAGGEDGGAVPGSGDAAGALGRQGQQGVGGRRARGGGGGGEGRGGVGAAAPGRGGGAAAAAAGAHRPRLQLLRGWAALPLPHRRHAVPHGPGIHHRENSVSWLISWCHNLCSDCIRKHNARCSAGDQGSSGQLPE